MKNTNTRFILFAIFIIVSQLLVFGCTPQKRLNRKVKRIERFANKHDLTINDTIEFTVRDTIYIPEYRYDTTTQIVHHETTTVINNERVRLRYFYDTLTREIWHEPICKSDTVYTENIVKVPIEKIKTVSKNTPFGTISIVLVLLSMCYLIYQIIKKTRI